MSISFNGCRILVVGDIILDQYLMGSNAGVTQESLSPKVAVQSEEFRLGGAANVARNLNSLGIETMLIGAIGYDKSGDTILSLLDEDQIPYHITRRENCQTTTKLRIIANGSQLVRADFESTMPEGVDKEISHAFKAYVEGVDVVIFSDYQKGTLDDIALQIDIAKQLDKYIIVDPKGANSSRYKGVSIMTPNLKEFESMMEGEFNQENILSQANSLINQLNLQHLIITCGEDGLVNVSADGEHTYLESASNYAVDATGAGDTFTAVLAAGIASGKDVAYACELGSKAAGLVVEQTGTSAVSLSALDDAMSRSDKAQPLSIFASQICKLNEEITIHSLESLNKQIHPLQKQNKRIVFTNGCFDILHAGHVNFLKKAKALGDHLVVAINSDDSVSRLKGPSRPINSLEYRSQVISGLHCVDWVISFDEDTPETLLKHLKPNILVKGGDYSRDQVIGADIVESYGGQVELIEIEYPGSTSETVRQIKCENP